VLTNSSAPDPPWSNSDRPTSPRRARRSARHGGLNSPPPPAAPRQMMQPSGTARMPTSGCSSGGRGSKRLAVIAYERREPRPYSARAGSAAARPEGRTAPQTTIARGRKQCITCDYGLARLVLNARAVASPVSSSTISADHPHPVVSLSPMNASRRVQDPCGRRQRCFGSPSGPSPWRPSPPVPACRLSNRSADRCDSVSASTHPRVLVDRQAFWPQRCLRLTGPPLPKPWQRAATWCSVPFFMSIR
jgi:hypothetical protein